MGWLASSHDAGGPAHLFVTLVQRRLQKAPELTLDRTVRLLQAALEEPEMRLPRATALVDYHVRRNEVARKSSACDVSQEKANTNELGAGEGFVRMPDGRVKLRTAWPLPVASW